MPSIIKDLNQFINKLIAEKGLKNLEPVVQEKIKADLITRLENRINTAIVAKLPPEKLEEFRTKLSNSNEADIQKFISENIPNLQEILAIEMISFRKTYLGQELP